MGELEDGIDRAIPELLRTRNQGYIGMDIRIRGDTVTSWCWMNEESFPENTSEDDISRLKEKLELLEQIRKVQEILKKFQEDHPDYVPIKVPEPYPYAPWHPAPTNPWPCPPYWHWNKDDTVDESIHVVFTTSGLGGQ